VATSFGTHFHHGDTGYALPHMVPSSPSTTRIKMGDVESHGKALEWHSSCIASALGISHGRLENERAWWYVVCDRLWRPEQSYNVPFTWNNRSPVAGLPPSVEVHHFHEE
jgi:hypothetical protein